MIMISGEIKVFNGFIELITVLTHLPFILFMVSCLISKYKCQPRQLMKASRAPDKALPSLVLGIGKAALHNT